MPGEVDDLETRDDVPFPDSAVDVDGSTVPHEAEQEAMREPNVPRQRVHLPVVASTGSLRLLDRVGVAVDISESPQGRRGATVIDVAVPEHDTRNPAEGRCRGGDLPRHALRARVVDHDTARGPIAQEVDIHHPHEPASEPPYAVGEGLEGTASKTSETRTRPDGGVCSCPHRPRR